MRKQHVLQIRKCKDKKSSLNQLLAAFQSLYIQKYRLANFAKTYIYTLNTNNI